MTRLKTSTKTYLGVTLVSLFIIAFMSSANAITYLYPTHTYIQRGTLISGGTYSLTQADGQVERIKWARDQLGTRYRLWVIFSMEPHRYYNIYGELLVETTKGWIDDMEIWIEYTDGQVIKYTTLGYFLKMYGYFYISLNSLKYLESITFYCNDYTPFGEGYNHYTNFDLIRAELV